MYLTTTLKCAAAFVAVFFIGTKAALEIGSKFSISGGTFLMRYSISRVKRMFLQFIGSLSPVDVAKSPGTDFSRNRKCNLTDTVSAILLMGAHSLNTDKDNYFFAARQDPPSKSAFVQQRNKLSENAFPFIFYSLNNLFPCKRKYKGLHLLACDGTSLNVPSLPGDQDSFLPFASGNGGFYQFHLNALYNLLEDRFIDAVITPKRLANEPAGLSDIVERNILGEPCLYIADRGYFSFNTLAHFQEASQFFLIRVKTPENQNSPIQGVCFPQENEHDISHTFIISRKRLVNNPDPGTYKTLRRERRFDYIDPEDRLSTYSIHLRIVKIPLSNGMVEYLVTNLPKARFPLHELKKLYHMRWGIETSFLHLKYNIALAYFHARKRSFIRQEIYARMIYYNLVSLIRGSVKIIQGDTKHKYKISASDAAAVCRRLLLGQISAKSAKELLLRYKSPIRPGRSSPRRVVSQRLRALNNRT